MNKRFFHLCLFIFLLLSAQTSIHWNDGGPLLEENDTVTFAELGLAEDHFSHPEVCLYVGVWVLH